MRTGRLVRGQALTELAVFGFLALLALSFIIQMGLRMNFRQEHEMGTFRRALLDAYNDNWQDTDNANDEPHDEPAGTAYHHFRDRQMPNPAEGFGLMLRERYAASSDVTWGHHLTYGSTDPTKGLDTQQRIIVRLNQDQLNCREGVYTEDVCRAVDFAGVTGPLFTWSDQDVTSNSVITQNAGSSSLVATTTQTSELHTSNGRVLNNVVSETIRHDF